MKSNSIIALMILGKHRKACDQHTGSAAFYVAFKCIEDVKKHSIHFITRLMPSLFTSVLVIFQDVQVPLLSC